jgi:hypothetical protein
VYIEKYALSMYNYISAQVRSLSKRSNYGQRRRLLPAVLLGPIIGPGRDSGDPRGLHGLFALKRPRGKAPGKITISLGTN